MKHVREKLPTYAVMFFTRFGIFLRHIKADASEGKDFKTLQRDRKEAELQNESDKNPLHNCNVRLTSTLIFTQFTFSYTFVKDSTLEVYSNKIHFLT